jgi:hypothetical protein
MAILCWAAKNNLRGTLLLLLTGLCLQKQQEELAGIQKRAVSVAFPILIFIVLILSFICIIIFILIHADPH